MLAVLWAKSQNIAMASFCENCPMKRGCIGSIERLQKFRLSEDGRTTGYAAVIVDEIGNSSEPIFPGSRKLEQVERAVELCEGVALESRFSFLNKLLGPKEICPAIGKLAISRFTEEYAIVREMTR